MTFLQIEHLTRARRDGTKWETPFKPGLNLIVGEKNSSKTTTLEIIDFCFGRKRSARRQFGDVIWSEYESFHLTIRIGENLHVLSRRLHVHGQSETVDVDGEVLAADEFDGWIMRQLRWPQLRIPHGTPGYATKDIALSFRSLYRHVYRDAESWTSFAQGEFPYYRRAVFAFFIGVAEQVYGSNSVAIVQAEQTQTALEQRKRELQDRIDRFVRQATEGYREAGASGLSSLDDLIDETQVEIDRVSSRFGELTHTLRADPLYESEIDSSLKQIDSDLIQSTERNAEIRQLHAEQVRLLSSLEGELQRVRRAKTATDAFGSFVVVSCPACYQPIQRVESNNGNEITCYVCQREVPADLRARRLDLEERSLIQEIDEFRGYVKDLAEQLIILDSMLTEVRHRKSALLSEMESKRASLIAPMAQERESLQFLLGGLLQRLESLERLKRLEDWIRELDEQRFMLDEEIGKLRAIDREIPSDILTIQRRSNLFAQQMDRFIDNLQLAGGLGGPIAIDPSTMDFYVGTVPWDQALGHERRVAFLLAYHGAFLSLTSQGIGIHPGLAILDNPFQQDLDPLVVERAMELLNDECNRDGTLQVIVATQRPLNHLRATREYYSETFDAPGM